MKTRILSVAMCLALAMSLSAQTVQQKLDSDKKECVRGKRPEDKMQKEGKQARQLTASEHAKRMADRMKTTLALTDKQYNEVYALLLDGAKKRELARTDNNAQRPTNEQMHEARKQFEQKIKGILSDEQYEKWQAERRSHHHRHHAAAHHNQQRGMADKSSK